MNRGSGDRLTDGRLGAVEGGVLKTRTFWMENVAKMSSLQPRQPRKF